MKLYRYGLGLIVCCLLLHTTSRAQQPDPEGMDSTLTVGTKEAPPFVIKNEDGTWSGISIDLWEQIATEKGYQFEYQEFDLEGLLNSVQNNEVDVAVAALTITEQRERVLDFTHPYFVTGEGILVKAKSSDWLGMVNSLFSKEFFQAVGGLAILLFVVGFLVWLFERRKNPEQFGGKALKGLSSGFWWSAVTMTTVGYGDKAPVTTGGRTIALIWMFMALIVISSFTAAIASALTLSTLSSSVESVDDLNDVRVGTVTASGSASFLRKNQINFRDFGGVETAMSALSEDKLGAVVYDKPIMSYLIKQEEYEDMKILPEDTERLLYGYAVPSGSPLLEPINVMILEITRSDDWDEVVFEYLGS